MVEVVEMMYAGVDRNVTFGRSTMPIHRTVNLAVNLGCAVRLLTFGVRGGMIVSLYKLFEDC